jgi:ubiquinone/menaquinone biosynthesis C-methylase UbiE
LRTFHARLQRFARSPLHRRYLAVAYTHSLEDARACGADPLAGTRPRVLLCGTGSAQTTAAFLGHLARARGAVEPLVLDLSHEPLRAAMASGARASFARADARDLPLEDGSVDLIESDFFLQYFDTEGKRRIVREWARVLSARGVITTRDYVARAGSGVDAFLDRVRVQTLRFFLARAFHTTSESEISSTFRDHGLEVSLSRFRVGGWGLPLVQSVTARRGEAPRA